MRLVLEILLCLELGSFRFELRRHVETTTRKVLALQIVLTCADILFIMYNRNRSEKSDSWLVGRLTLLIMLSVLLNDL